MAAAERHCGHARCQPRADPAARPQAAPGQQRAPAGRDGGAQIAAVGIVEPRAEAERAEREDEQARQCRRERPDALRAGKHERAAERSRAGARDGGHRLVAVALPGHHGGAAGEQPDRREDRVGVGRVGGVNGGAEALAGGALGDPHFAAAGQREQRAAVRSHCERGSRDAADARRRAEPPSGRRDRGLERALQVESARPAPRARRPDGDRLAARGHADLDLGFQLPVECGDGDRRAQRPARGPESRADAVRPRAVRAGGLDPDDRRVAALGHRNRRRRQRVRAGDRRRRGPRAARLAQRCQQADLPVVRAHDRQHAGAVRLRRRDRAVVDLAAGANLGAGREPAGAGGEEAGAGGIQAHELPRRPGRTQARRAAGDRGERRLAERRRSRGRRGDGDERDRERRGAHQRSLTRA